MKKIKLNTAFVLLSISSAFGQIPSAAKEIKIGDTIPPVMLTHFLNDTAKLINISKLYSKGPLIIDFWATWCVPCIHEMQKIDSLSKKYPGRFNVISVTYEQRNIVSEFLGRHAEMRNLVNPILTNDVILAKLFPHRSLPHNVWIDKKGIVVAITGGDEVNEKNIVSFIAGSGFQLPTKHDNMAFDWNKPYHLADTSFISRTIFTHYDPGINSGTVNDRPVYSNGYMKRAFGWNSTSTELFYLAAFPLIGHTGSYKDYDRMEIHTKDSTRFFYEKYKKNMRENRFEWSSKNLFCYELSLPKPIPDTIFAKYMMADLERNFNVTAKIEKRLQPCWVMTRKAGSLPYPHSNKSKLYYATNGHDLTAEDISIKDFVDIVVHGTWNIKPIIDETHLDYPIDIIVPFDKGLTVEMVMNFLREKGFEFKEEMRSLNKLILYDNNK